MEGWRSCRKIFTSRIVVLRTCQPPFMIRVGAHVNTHKETNNQEVARTVDGQEQIQKQKQK
jgi:hypothetical protein